VIDLPGHGRSSGLHAYLPSLDKAADAVHSVLIDIQAASNPTEKLFLGGASLGGLISTLVCMYVPFLLLSSLKSLN
jgi:acylglycerol lipase